MIKKITVTSARRDNGKWAVRASELGSFECYAPSGFDPSFDIKAGDVLKIDYYQPNDFISKQSLPYYVAERIEKAHAEPLTIN